MTDAWPQDSPVVARLYCPTCEPETDPINEIVDVMWCGNHHPDRSGDVDHVVSAHNYLSGGTEAGGEDNRLWCDFLHRKNRDG